MNKTEKRLVKMFVGFVIVSVSIFGLCVCALFIGGRLPRDPAGKLSELIPTRGPTSTLLPPTVTPLPTAAPLPTATIDIAREKLLWNTVDIRALAKNPSEYVGQQLHYQGEVFVISQADKTTVMQVWVKIPGGSQFDQEAVLVKYIGNTDNIYKGTAIEFWGFGVGDIEGKNAFGASVSSPVIDAKYVN